MSELARADAVDRVEEILRTVEEETMPVPVRELWVLGDVALGLDPVDRLDVYVTKDILLSGEADAGAEFESEYGMEGVGQTVRTAWAEAYPEYLRANPNGYAAPEKCLAAHLLADDEPVHLEVCNAGFEDNVTQRLEGAKARGDYEQILDPRGACLWIDDGDGGRRSEEALRKLREGEFVFPPLAGALEMLGMDDEAAGEAAEAVAAYRDRQDGSSVRGDVV